MMAPPTGTEGLPAKRGALTGRATAWRQTLIITLVAIGVFVGIRSLPVSGTALHARDFHAGGMRFFEFCAPGSPQFAPVDQVRSPVEIEIVPDQPPVAGAMVDCTLRMTTASGKPVVAGDLFVVHTEKLHLLVIDPSLDDYQHLHPVAADESGEFRFSFRPKHGGSYRMFADFTPRATGRSLYAGAGLDVAGTESPERNHSARKQDLQTTIGGVEFTLVPRAMPVRINEATGLTLVIRRNDRLPLRLEEIMGAAAHMVAFDAGVSGFAHLHPVEAGEDDPPPPRIGALVDEARLTFSLQLSDPGYYRLWAQVKIEGEELFAAFGVPVQP